MPKHETDGSTAALADTGWRAPKPAGLLSCDAVRDTLGPPLQKTPGATHRGPGRWILKDLGLKPGSFPGGSLREQIKPKSCEATAVCLVHPMCPTIRQTISRAGLGLGEAKGASRHERRHWLSGEDPALT